jgi:hypothetical protein
MAQADEKPSTAIWLSEAKALLVERLGGSSRVAEELLRDKFSPDPSLWGYVKKRGDALDGELWQSARIDFAEGCAIKQARRSADPVPLLNDDGVIGMDMHPGAINKGGVSPDGRPLVHTLPTGAGRHDLSRTEWLGIWVSRAHVQALLPKEPSEQEAAIHQAPVSSPRKVHRRYRRDSVDAVVAELWPNGPPEASSTADLLRILGRQLDQRSIPASLDTQLRSLGRRRK